MALKLRNACGSVPFERRGQSLTTLRVNIGLNLIAGSMILGPIGFQVYPSTPFLLAELVTSQSVSMEAAAWNILYGPSMPEHPNSLDRGRYFDFPSCNDTNACSVHYVTVPVSKAASISVRAIFQIATAGTPVFHYKLQPDTRAATRHTSGTFRGGSGCLNKFFRVDKWSLFGGYLGCQAEWQRGEVGLIGRGAVKARVWTPAIIQRGLRTPTGPFFANNCIDITPGSAAMFACMKRLRRPMVSSSVAR